MRNSMILHLFRKNPYKCIQREDVTEDNIIAILKRILYIHEDWLQFLKESNRFRNSTKIGGFLLGTVSGYTTCRFLFNSIDEISEQDQWDIIGWGVEFANLEHVKSDVTKLPTERSVYQMLLSSINWNNNSCSDWSIINTVVSKFIDKISYHGQFPAQSIIKLNDIFKNFEEMNDNEIISYLSRLVLSNKLKLETANRILKPTNLSLSSLTELMSKIS